MVKKIYYVTMRELQGMQKLERDIDQLTYVMLERDMFMLSVPKRVPETTIV